MSPECPLPGRHSHLGARELGDEVVERHVDRERGTRQIVAPLLGQHTLQFLHIERTRHADCLSEERRVPQHYAFAPARTTLPFASTRTPVRCNTSTGLSSAVRNCTGCRYPVPSATSFVNTPE